MQLQMPEELWFFIIILPFGEQHQLLCDHVDYLKFPLILSRASKIQ